MKRVAAAAIAFTALAQPALAQNDAFYKLEISSVTLAREPATNAVYLKLKPLKRAYKLTLPQCRNGAVTLTQELIVRDPKPRYKASCTTDAPKMPSYYSGLEDRDTEDPSLMYSWYDPSKPRASLYKNTRSRNHGAFVIFFQIAPLARKRAQNGLHKNRTGDPPRAGA